MENPTKKHKKNCSYLPPSLEIIIQGDFDNSEEYSKRALETIVQAASMDFVPPPHIMKDMIELLRKVDFQNKGLAKMLEKGKEEKVPSGFSSYENYAYYIFNSLRTIQKLHSIGQCCNLLWRGVTEGQKNDDKDWHYFHSILEAAINYQKKGQLNNFLALKFFVGLFDEEGRTLGDTFQKLLNNSASPSSARKILIESTMKGISNAAIHSDMELIFTLQRLLLIFFHTYYESEERQIFLSTAAECIKSFTDEALIHFLDTFLHFKAKQEILNELIVNNFTESNTKGETKGNIPVSLEKFMSYFFQIAPFPKTRRGKRYGYGHLVILIYHLWQSYVHTDLNIKDSMITKFKTETSEFIMNRKSILEKSEDEDLRKPALMYLRFWAHDNEFIL